MAIKLRKSYRFALRSSSIVSLTLTLVLLAIQYLTHGLEWVVLLSFLGISFLVSFVIIQLRVEKFIYRRIKKIYDEVSLLESSTLANVPVTTDMKTLTEEIGKFAQGKKIEIDTLKIREEYRKDFLGNVSHELKTPLFTVQGYILTLLDGAMNDKKIREKYLQRAAKGVDRLIYIIKDLDLITKLEAGDLHLVPVSFDIVELIQQVFDMLEIRAQKKEITMSFDLEYTQPIMVTADKDKIQQVLINLIVNSIKYGHKGGTTEISIENLIKNKIIVRVTDNGEGIEKSNIPRLFERFYRVDKSGARSEGGSGLGLSIVKHILEAHEEKIYVESVPDVGSEFSFTLEKTPNNEL
ncbi:MAG: ATP-binding protein [Flavobacteriaceae bacterium]|jgi:two-component system phosphate regulon sensor histidine kinase PhoR|nr:ATP-binding protein [Flavobacteriaceae bacterium]MCI5088074.1 ATP-binding protein [Flavobacteriaceae bacterium]CAI8183606.1 MAG: Alkaline phosphatase synthesis sensor protein PhoR [SAR116 cluster bacterium]